MSALWGITDITRGAMSAFDPKRTSPNRGRPDPAALVLAESGRPAENEGVILNATGLIVAGHRRRQELHPSIDLPQRAQNARPAPRSFFETLEIVLLVRRVDTVVVEGKTHEQRLHAELGAERFHDWNGTAAAHHHRHPSPFCLESFRRGRKGRR